MQKTKIVCTIGPASQSPDMLREMINAGMNVARLNFSHGTHEDHLEVINNIKQIRKEMGQPVAILLDTKGPEIRLKTFEDGIIELHAGDEFTLTTRDVPGTRSIVAVSYEHLPRNVQPGTLIMVDDGLIELKAVTVTNTDIICAVVVGGELSNRKGVNLPGVSVDMPFISEKDKADLRFAYEHDVDYIALSFVRSAEDVLQTKSYLASFGLPRSQLISKIENAEGVNNIDEIIRESDGIMVARGDMGVEIPFEDLPKIQKDLIQKCYSAGKRVITATQMLESMIKSPRPTRAEITDIANAIHDGTSAIMLSGETAKGDYPILCIQTMVKIAEATEASINYKARFSSLKKYDTNITNAISYATCSVAHDLDAVAILALTANGTAARLISRYRPASKIIAVTPNEKTYYQMALSWGVTPVLGELHHSPETMRKAAIDKILAKKLAKEGELIVITGSSTSLAAVTNTLQVEVLGDIITSGTGHTNNESVSARAHVIRAQKEAAEFADGSIIVIDRTTPEALRFVRRAKGVVTEESFAMSGIAAAALALDLPLITDATDATKLIVQGIGITVNPENGTVCNIH
ncbi:MAG: pyruvate kinase [Defluviitaleaceae bacterium]|nr:pyruvate kinase [Defluviitaleaceae bacterium]